MTPTENNPWPEYRLLLLDFCEETKIRLDKGEIKDDKLEEEIALIRTEIHKLEIKLSEQINSNKIAITSIQTKMAIVASVVGLVAGLVPTVVQIIWHFL
jgi:hypothetical protein